ncbi:DUF6285 domain-containing protein [Dactylosporangium sp. NPDC000244]|uniref:DUF6285 domain-containing protein n=1 Tax=Dactylosporangium sp. NPDC000244 TaxID=3154365 RepID=UPI003321BF77|nr:hypothetical protein GCM10020063_064180 [Dactylosporangium thailandense]
MPSHAAVPGHDELLTAVVETLQAEILPEAGGRARYLLKACVAALETVRRDLAAGSERELVDGAVFAELGVPDERALVAEIRAGLDPARFAQMVAALGRRTEVELRVLGRA